jgi:hypothetical protein
VRAHPRRQPRPSPTGLVRTLSCSCPTRRGRTHDATFKVLASAADVTRVWGASSHLNLGYGVRRSKRHGRGFPAGKDKSVRVRGPAGALATVDVPHQIG